jgi:hypothetical protein
MPITKKTQYVVQKEFPGGIGDFYDWHSFNTFSEAERELREIRANKPPQLARIVKRAIIDDVLSN